MRGIIIYAIINISPNSHVPLSISTLLIFREGKFKLSHGTEIFVDSVLSAFSQSDWQKEIEIRLNIAQNYPLTMTLFLCMQLILTHYRKAAFTVLNFYWTCRSPTATHTHVLEVFSGTSLQLHSMNCCKWHSQLEAKCQYKMTGQIQFVVSQQSTQYPQYVNVNYAGLQWTLAQKIFLIHDLEEYLSIA